MKTRVPPWPAGLPRTLRPISHFKHNLHPHQLLDRLAIRRARQVRDEDERLSNLTGTWGELLFKNTADYTAVASFTTEVTLLKAAVTQPTIPAEFFDLVPFRAIRILARGVVSSTGTPTYTFTNRWGTTVGANVTGTIFGISAAITTANNATNALWEMGMDLECYASGQGTGNATISGTGYVQSFAGFASPFQYNLVPSQGALATWTTTIDASVTQYIQLNIACSANSASNSIQLKQLLVWGMN